MTEDSDKGNGKESTNSEDSKKNHNMENKSEKNDKSEDSPISGMISSLKKFAMVDDLDETSSAKTKSPEKPKTNGDVISKETINGEDHSFHLSHIFGQRSTDSLVNRKDKIIKYSALVIGGLLIVYGLVLISGSVTKVADNVIFGEKAMLSTFLILLGVLIIVAAFAQRILNKTFLNKIHNELEVAEGRSVTDEDQKKVEDENGNKVGKDNIVGENKGNKGG